mgnify:CR=1 FL=1
MFIRAPKDGYTLLYAQNSPLTIRRVIDPEAANYDPLQDLTPLGLTTRSPSVLVVRKDAPFKTLKEMIAYAPKAPNGLRVVAVTTGFQDRDELAAAAAGR